MLDYMDETEVMDSRGSLIIGGELPLSCGIKETTLVGGCLSVFEMELGPTEMFLFTLLGCDV